MHCDDFDFDILIKLYGAFVLTREKSLFTNSIYNKEEG